MIQFDSIYRKGKEYDNIYQVDPESKKVRRGLLYSKNGLEDDLLEKTLPYLYVGAKNSKSLSVEMKDIYKTRLSIFLEEICVSIEQVIASHDVSSAAIYDQLLKQIKEKVKPYYQGIFRMQMSREISYLPLDVRLLLYYELYQTESDDETKFHLLDRLSVTLGKMDKVNLAQAITLYQWVVELENNKMSEKEILSYTRTSLKFIKDAKKIRKSIMNERGFQEKKLDEFKNSIFGLIDLSNMHDKQSAIIMAKLWKIYFSLYKIPGLEEIESKVLNFIKTEDQLYLSGIPLDQLKRHEGVYVFEESERMDKESLRAFYQDREEKLKSYIQALSHLRERLQFDEDEKEMVSIPRNQKCPCGSGLKYKKCCEKKESIKETTEYTLKLFADSEKKEQFIQSFQSAKQGDANAQCQVSLAYFAGEVVTRNTKKALELMEQSALNGSPKGQFELGTMYLHGHHLRKDYSKALYWLEKAHNQGFRAATSSLGGMYKEGFGVKKDYEKAVQLLTKANDAHALTQLAYMYQNGMGVPQSYVRAVELYKASLELEDNLDALFNLGMAYYHGIGTLKNHQKTKSYLSKAAKLGDQQAMQTIKQLGL